MSATSSVTHETASADGASAKSPQAYELNEELSDGHVRKHLAHDVTWACELIDRLIEDGGDESMKPGIFNACEGVAFVRVAKGGLGITMARGSGFVIRKLEQDRFGSSRWSAPVYFSVSQLGVGLAAGYESVETCMALMSYHSVARFTTEHVMVGTDLGTLSTDGAMSGVPAGTTLGRSAHMDVNADHEHACFAYSTANGLLANLSINGTETHPNTDLNGKLYGASTSLEDVLAGKAKTFAEFLPLYRKIKETAVKALQ